MMSNVFGAEPIHNWYDEASDSAVQEKLAPAPVSVEVSCGEVI